MYESNYDSFEFIFQETSLLDNQPWNKGHGLYCELYPQKRRRIACFSRKLQATLEFIQTVLLWLVPSLLSFCDWLWFAFLFGVETLSTFKFPCFFAFHTFHQLGSNLREFSCPTISAQLLHFWESASSSLVFPEPERTCTSVFFFAFNFWMEQNSVTNSSNAGANLRKEDTRQMIECKIWMKRLRSTLAFCGKSLLQNFGFQATSFRSSATVKDGAMQYSFDLKANLSLTSEFTSGAEYKRHIIVYYILSHSWCLTLFSKMLCNYVSTILFRSWAVDGTSESAGKRHHSMPSEGTLIK